MKSFDSRPVPLGFATTQWSLVLRAGARGEDDAARSLAALCEGYWFPLYAFVRRQLGDRHEAQDVTQSFFVRLLEKQVLAEAAPERGRFRSFLLAAMRNFLANEWDRRNTLKRGGGRTHFPIDFESGESRLSLEPAHELTPERAFERQWACTLLEHVAIRLRDELVAAGKERQYELLRGALSGDAERLSYAAIAAELGITGEAARQAAQRLKRRFRELLREEVTRTVADAADVDEELRSLFTSLS